MTHHSFPNSDHIYSLYTGGFISQFIRLALQLDIFSALSSEPANAERVTRHCRTDIVGTQALLDYLCSIEILEFNLSNHTYSLSPTAARFLLRSSKSYAGDWVLALTDPTLFESMRLTVQSGKSPGYILPWVQDAWLESYSPSQIEYSLEMWQAVDLEVKKQHQSLEIIDLACGCGVKTLALAQVNRNVCVTCVDSESVLEVAKDLAKRLGVEARSNFVEGDILTADLGKEKYDAALLGLITYIFTPNQNRRLFQRVNQILKPGGKLVIDAIMSTDQPTEWSSRATLLMGTWNGGAAHSFTDYHNWLTLAGFKNVIQHNQRLLSAIK